MLRDQEKSKIEAQSRVNEENNPPVTDKLDTKERIKRIPIDRSILIELGRNLVRQGQGVLATPPLTPVLEAENLVPEKPIEPKKKIDIRNFMKGFNSNFEKDFQDKLGKQEVKIEAPTSTPLVEGRHARRTMEQRNNSSLIR